MSRQGSKKRKRLRELRVGNPTTTARKQARQMDRLLVGERPSTPLATKKHSYVVRVPRWYGTPTSVNLQNVRDMLTGCGVCVLGLSSVEGRDGIAVRLTVGGVHSPLEVRRKLQICVNTHVTRAAAKTLNFQNLIANTPYFQNTKVTKTEVDKDDPTLVHVSMEIPCVPSTMYVSRFTLPNIVGNSASAISSAGGDECPSNPSSGRMVDHSDEDLPEAPAEGAGHSAHPGVDGARDRPVYLSGDYPQ